MFYYPFWCNGVPWNYLLMAYWVLGAPLRGGASMGGPPKGYISVFCFSFRFREISKYIWPIGEPLGLF